jgi:hypothetical protein
MTQSPPKHERPVIVCTTHRGVFYGFTDKTNKQILTDDIVHLSGCMMVIYWGTTRGVMQLAATGPTPSTKASLRADITINSITAVFDATEEAASKWSTVV